MSGTVCNDNRFDLIAKYKAKLIEATNIETSSDEMAVIDNILFRMWQMGWFDKLDAASPWHRVEEELPSMDGYDWVLGIVTGEAGYLRFYKAVMTVSFDPQYKEWFIDEYPDARITVSHWMLLPEPPKEDA